MTLHITEIDDSEPGYLSVATDTEFPFLSSLPSKQLIDFDTVFLNFLPGVNYSVYVYLSKPIIPNAMHKTQSQVLPVIPV